ncbi:MAG: iron-containing redox enzyme family protein [Bacteriovorax sp.]|nr:iron-containing redox enzyme family protein [Bacteriovorax sp.]
MKKKLELSLELTIKNSMAQIEEYEWENKNFYADYMAQTFYYVRHSTRLLALCASRLNYEQEQQIHLRFIKHLSEESNHEKLALNDLANLGHNIDQFPELNSTRLFYEPQYFKIEHEKPLALMGYILFLEALAQKVCPPLTKKLTSCFGKRSATFFHVHGEEDPEHVAEALKMIQGLDDSNLFVIEKNLRQTAYAYSQMLHELKLKWHNLEIKKSA